MRKSLLIAMVCLFGFFGALNAQTITIGTGDEYSQSLPFDVEQYFYSATQQLYTATELNKIEGCGVINNIAFKSATANMNKSYISIYMVNTSKTSFSGEDWINVTNNDKVFEGYLATTAIGEWSDVELSTPFVYTGGNVMVCVSTNAQVGVEPDKRDAFYTFMPELTEGAPALRVSSSDKIDPTTISDELKASATPEASKNQIRFKAESSEDVITNFESIDFGKVALGEYWSANEKPSVVLSIASYYTKITNVACSDPFFTISSEIDYNTLPVKVVVSYDNTASAGEKSANITITDNGGTTVTIPVTATAYTPVTPDVFELAQEITFTNNVYNDEPVFANLNDDYLLPNEDITSVAPDAVYKLTVPEETMVLVDVTGTNPKYALYEEDFGGENGPMATNAYEGEVKVLNTAFYYDFANVVPTDFIVEDYDDYKDFSWGIDNGVLISYSFCGWYGENGAWEYINKADERIMTSNAFAITPNSVLEFDMSKGEYDFEEVIIEVTQDGEIFTEVEKVFYHEYTTDWKTCKIDMGARFASLGLEYGDYQIVLYHKLDGVGCVKINNLNLTERSSVIVAGDYYLVVAAEDAYKVTVSLGEVPEDPTAPATPTNLKAEAASQTSIKLTWDAVENATSYRVYQGTNVIANPTEPTYTIEGLEENKEYCYTVTAVNINLESEESDIACAETVWDAIEENTAVFNVYPNPVENEVRIASVEKIEEVTIYNVVGTTVYNVQCTMNDVQLNVSELNSGVYFVKVRTENTESVSRIVKK